MGRSLMLIRELSFISLVSCSLYIYLYISISHSVVLLSVVNFVHVCVSRADQLKSVMEQVLNFAVRELTKIVEASFDDLLLEITKMEREHQVLEERLDKSSNRGGGGEKGRAGRRRGSENDSVSPSGSEDAREELAEVPVSKEMAETEGEFINHVTKHALTGTYLCRPSLLLVRGGTKGRIHLIWRLRWTSQLSITAEPF